MMMLLICSAVLWLAPGASSQVSGRAWDQDGGLTQDYSGIPRLKWMGPGEPGTYRDHLQRKGLKPFRIAHAYSSSAARNGIRSPKALVLVDDGLHGAIQPKLDVYVADLEYDGYLVEVYKISGGTPMDLKAFILNHADNLAGCSFVGDLPVAWYEMDIWDHEEFPCDLYYMDLDGSWTDADSDGLFDGHTAGTGDEGPEIFIGHIDTSMMTGDEAGIANAYLDKLHVYKKGGFPVPGYALSYTEDDWSHLFDIRTDIKYSYPDFDDIAAPHTNRDDFLYDRVPSPGYEFIQVCCHSSPFGHYFTRGGVAWNHDIMAVVPQAAFYNLFACSSLRYTEADFLGGAFIYNASATSLGVIGSTKTGSMLVFREFYIPLGMNETFGEAFRLWFNALAPYDQNERAWHYGMTIAGDPFLYILDEPAIHIGFPEGLPGPTCPPGPETRMLVEVRSGLQKFVPGTAQFHYRFHPADPYTAAALNPLGGDLYEAVLPCTKPGDEPEFYFSAQGDFGTLVCSPPGAPETVYSFDVCFLELHWEDDFEGDLGWKVDSTGIITGEWERADPGKTDAQPEDDHTPDGTHCYVTGRLGGAPSLDDVDEGPTRLISPAIDLSGGDARISFYVWFYHGPEGKEQPLKVHLSSDGGAMWIPVEDITHNPQWSFRSYKVSDFVTPGPGVKIRFTARDTPDNGVVEALVDDLEVRRYVYDPSLWADAYSIPAAAGRKVNFFLEAGAGCAYRPYLLLGTLSGTAPGFHLPGGQHMPINWDPFTTMMLSLLGTPAFQDFMGGLDGSGAAKAAFDTLGPLDPALIGQTLSFAYLLGGAPGYDFSSNPMDVAVE